VRYVVFAAAILFVTGMALLEILYLENNGFTPVGVLGLLVVIMLGIGVLGSLTQPPRR
jgi:hypothetical protein